MTSADHAVHLTTLPERFQIETLVCGVADGGAGAAGAGDSPSPRRPHDPQAAGPGCPPHPRLNKKRVSIQIFLVMKFTTQHDLY